ncbi:MATE efflux family protein [Ignisphaera aggregans DSM 17230]|uniref:MATE efflux family protein n=1 Tax=Ignisphaera aggregans (strain DSM 17230 / JCM 13409 / AQ1.S1) TaxID=583356 RepID=E0SR87_IGNAA|nr:MATE efflux family protein [Ignisphaera aggregans DSM 17230]
MGSLDRYRDRIINGPIYRTLLWLGLPAVSVQLVNISYNIADAYWLSRYSPIDVAIPRQIWPSFMMFQALAMAIGAANQALISQYIGAKMYVNAIRTIKQYFTLSFILGAIMSITYYLLRPLIFLFISSPPQEIVNGVLNYSAIISIDLFTSYFVLCFSIIIQSAGDTRRPAIVNAISATINIILDPFLILGIYLFPRLGVIGAAIATVLARIVGAIILYIIMHRKFPFIEIGITTEIDREWLMTTFRIGIPILLQNIFNSLAFQIQLRLINSFGVATSVAWSIGFTVIDIANSVLWGLSQATAIMVGQNLGANNIDRSKKIARYSQILIGSIIAIGSCFAYIIRHNIITLFIDPSDPEVNSIYSETENFLKYALFTIPFFGIFFVGSSVGRGSGHVLIPTIIDIIRLWIVRIALGYILSQYLGSTGIWIAFALSNMFSGISATIWIQRGKWAKPIIKRSS